MWNTSVNVEPIDFNKNTIAMKIRDVVYVWHMVGFYGPQYAKKKSKA